VKVSTVFIVEPVSRIQRQEFDLGSLWQIGRLVDNKAAGFDSCLQRHVITVAPQLLRNKAVRQVLVEV
jgi:hypothetical protein